ncbi:hypothetical protein TNCV_4357401 [Trichonephila clavipes]|nr:hypothetical protein TNCV_4357401 [Trichonephila clavipes]
MNVRSVKGLCVWLNERVRLMVLNSVVEYSRKRIPTLFAGVILDGRGRSNPPQVTNGQEDAVKAAPAQKYLSRTGTQK